MFYICSLHYYAIMAHALYGSFCLVAPEQQREKVNKLSIWCKPWHGREIHEYNNGAVMYATKLKMLDAPACVLSHVCAGGYHIAVQVDVIWSDVLPMACPRTWYAAQGQPLGPLFVMSPDVILMNHFKLEKKINIKLFLFITSIS